MKKMPALIDGETRIFDSTIILEDIEDKWPSPPLLPATPAARAAARTIEDVMDTHFEPINWGLGEIRWFKRAEGKQAADMTAKAAAQTRQLLDWLTERLGDKEWFGGETFGWADLSVAPYLNRSVHYGIGPLGESPLKAWHTRLCARPSVAATFKEFEGATQGMANAAERLASGAIRREYRDHRLEWMIKSGGVEVVLAGLRDDNIRFPWPDAS